MMGGGGQMPPGGVIEQDLTGDGQVDLIINVGNIECNESRNYGCGTLGCSTFFYVRQGERLVENLNVNAWDVSVGEGEPPVITLSGGGATIRRQWNGQTFAEPGPETLPQTARRWRYDPSHGLAGLASIQGENGSTLRVACGNGGFPSLTLHDANTPLNAVLTFQLDGVPAQGYQADCGDDQACTIESGYEGSLALTRGLMARNTLTIAWNGRPVDRYTLAGSSAAISQMGSRGCDL